MLLDRPQRVNELKLANVDDHQPLINIPMFGMCTSMANPSVASATASTGVLTPMPCMPPGFTPWIPGATYVTEEYAPGVSAALLTSDSQCICQFAGRVEIDSPGTTIEID